MNKLRKARIEKRKADKWWSKEVRKIYNNRCAICGSGRYLNAHHIIPREFEILRWNPGNGIALCPKHHKFGKYSAHKNAVWFVRYLLIENPERMKQLGELVDSFYLQDGINH